MVYTVYQRPPFIEPGSTSMSASFRQWAFDANGCPVFTDPVQTEVKTEDLPLETVVVPVVETPNLPALIPPPPLQPPRRLVIRCTSEYHAWACGLADWMGGLDLTLLVETGLRKLAEGSGFEQLPPRRYYPVTALTREERRRRRRERRRKD
jgi:hypothetical protein